MAKKSIIFFPAEETWWSRVKDFWLGGWKNPLIRKRRAGQVIAGVALTGTLAAIAAQLLGSSSSSTAPTPIPTPEGSGYNGTFPFTTALPPTSPITPSSTPAITTLTQVTPIATTTNTDGSTTRTQTHTFSDGTTQTGSQTISTTGSTLTTVVTTSATSSTRLTTQTISVSTSPTPVTSTYVPTTTLTTTLTSTAMSTSIPSTVTTTHVTVMTTLVQTTTITTTTTRRPTNPPGRRALTSHQLQSYSNRLAPGFAAINQALKPAGWTDWATNMGHELLSQADIQGVTHAIGQQLTITNGGLTPAVIDAALADYRQVAPESMNRMLRLPQTEAGFWYQLQLQWGWDMSLFDVLSAVLKYVATAPGRIVF